MPALWQLEHGCRLSQRTLRRRQVVHDRGFRVGLVGLAVGAVVGEVRLLKFLRYCSEEKVFEKVSIFAPKAA